MKERRARTRCGQSLTMASVCSALLFAATVGTVSGASVLSGSQDSGKASDTTKPDTIESVLSRLRSEPVSTLDFGMEMMWRDLADTAKDRSMDYYGRVGAFPPYIGITYDSNEGKFWIAIESNPGTEGFHSQSPDPSQRGGHMSAEAWCKTLVSKLRVNLAGYPNQPPRWLRYFVNGHGHTDFADLPNAPELIRLNEILPKLFFLRAHAADDHFSVTCTGPLVGSTVSIESKPVNVQIVP